MNYSFSKEIGCKDKNLVIKAIKYGVEKMGGWDYKNLTPGEITPEEMEDGVFIIPRFYSRRPSSFNDSTKWHGSSDCKYGYSMAIRYLDKLGVLLFLENGVWVSRSKPENLLPSGIAKPRLSKK